MKEIIYFVWLVSCVPSVDGGYSCVDKERMSVPLPSLQSCELYINSWKELRRNKGKIYLCRSFVWGKDKK